MNDKLELKSSELVLSPEAESSPARLKLADRCGVVSIRSRGRAHRF